ncbi:MAG TPA: ABC transporter substrate-binding protein [Pseudolabrys sp.]|nr:ABC transporter substrate-binding protein [Pseudolabrys sp.]
MRRREFFTLVGGVAAAGAWPSALRAQQSALPIIGFVNTGSAEGLKSRAVAFRKGLSETGFVEGKDVTIEYHWLEGRTDQLPAVMADLVRRKVSVIATPGSVVAALAAKAATTTVPIAFAVPEDPVRLGLVANLGRPGGNATGINTFSQEVTGKRLRLLHDLVPKATRFAVLVNPGNASSSQSTLREVRKAAGAIGVQIQKTLNASTIGEIDGAFDVLARERVDALFVASDAFFNSRGVQFATSTARERIPAAYSDREVVAAGGLMSYGADLADMARQVGIYAGSILKGAKPADLPVLQSAKFKFALNLQTARTLGIDVPAGILSIADDVVE